VSSSDVVVVGGGALGASVAFALAREGLSVTLVERDRVAAHASGAAAGMLAPIAESLGSGPLFEAGIQALELLPAWIDEVQVLSGIDPQLVRGGLLRLATTARRDELLERMPALEPYGCEWLERDELHKRVPGLAPGSVGAIWSPAEAHLEPGLLTRAVAAAAASRGASLELGVEATGLVREGSRVTGVRLASGTLPAGEVVLCGGAWTQLWEEAVGQPLPVEPVRGQILALEAPRPAIPSILFGEDVYLVPRRDGTLAAGATVERVGFDVRTTAEGLRSLLAAASALVPGLAECTFLRAWAGLRPATPDLCPLIGRVPDCDGLSVATGHYRNGILLAPLTGLWIADSLLHGEAADLPAAFAPGRFRPGRGSD
jgi:glycine oxidase